MSKERQNISAKAIFARVVPIFALAASAGCTPRSVGDQETPSPIEPISAEYIPTPIPSTSTPEIVATATEVQELPTEPFRLEGGQPQEFAGGAWQEVKLPEIPESLEPTVILGENGRLQIKMDLINYDAPDGLVIGEYQDGEWKPVPFAFTRPAEIIGEALVLDYSNYVPSVEEFFRHPENGLDIISYGGPFLGMRLEVDETTGETRVEMLMIQRFAQDYESLKIIKISPSALHLNYGRTYDEQERYDPSSLSVATIAKIIEFAERPDPSGESFGFSVFIVTDEVSEDFSCEAPAWGPGFEEYCREMLGNKDRPTKSAAEFKEVIWKHSLSPGEDMLASGIDWWDDNLLPALSGDNSWTVATFYNW